MKYLKNISFLIILFLVLNIIITILSYFDIFSEKGINILKIILFTIILAITGFKIGTNSKKKAYIEGLKFSLIIILILTILNLILPMIDFSIKIIPYYLLISIILAISSSIGINFKKKSN